MGIIDPLPSDLFEAATFVDGVEPADTVHFVLNVGNGDTQLLLTPEEDGLRRVIVVDVATTKKLPALLAALHSEAQDRSLFPPDSTIGLIVATHPHSDHIRGMADLLRRFTGRIEEFWDTAFRATNGYYNTMMDELGRRRSEIRVLHPTAGTQRVIGSTLVTALGPDVATRNQYDILGVEPNNASIGLKIEFPVRGATNADHLPGVGRVYRPLGTRLQRLVLGADAQTDAWATITRDFPRLSSDSPLFAHLKRFIDAEPLRAQVFKVPHHGSKHGMNLELVERAKPRLSLVTANGSGEGYAFPHAVAMELLREALENLATKGPAAVRSPDWALGIHYTGADQLLDDGSATPLGSIAVVMSPTGRKFQLWRFQDHANQPVGLSSSLRYRGPI